MSSLKSNRLNEALLHCKESGIPLEALRREARIPTALFTEIRSVIRN